MRPNYSGKTVAVLGLGISNTPLIEFLLSHGATITARDKKPYENLPELVRAYALEGVTFRCGEDYLADLQEDIIFRSPGIRPDKPEILTATALGSRLTSEMELFFELCPCPIIGVTGSDGKTTTTTLIAKALAMQYGEKRVYVGGNIGTPLLPLVEEMNKNCFAVVELSSFQLQTMRRSPKIAVVTNLSPNHLDWHTDMEEYEAAKANIFLHQKPGGKVVLNFKNPVTKSMAEKVPTGSDVVWFNSPEGVCARDGAIHIANSPIMLLSDILVPGKHNVENYMAVIAALHGIVDPDIIVSLAREFPGVPHRIEFVRELEGVKYYNSSIDSSPSRTTAALSSFEQKLIVICGGYDKNLPFEPLADILIKKAKAIVLTGATADKIESAIAAHPDFDPLSLRIIRRSDFKDAVIAAKGAAEPNDIVILSPACASFDAFPNFEVRGNTFKDVVFSFVAEDEA